MRRQIARWLALLLVVLVGTAKADLPIHCIKAQVEGQWQLYLSLPQTIEEPEQAKCGYLSPSTSLDALQNVPSDSFKTSRTINVKLDKYNQVYDADKETGIIGKWTMMYDEGMIIDLDDGTSIMVYFSFTMNAGKGYSDCSKTLIGWFRDSQRQMGCMHALQTVKGNPTVQSYSLGEDIVGISKTIQTVSMLA